MRRAESRNPEGRDRPACRVRDGELLLSGIPLSINQVSICEEEIEEVVQTACRRFLDRARMSLIRPAG
jgi:hypothetical protein